MDRRRVLQEGNKASFPYKTVTIQVIPNAFQVSGRAQVTCLGEGSNPPRASSRFASPNFHTADFEFDYV